MFFRNKKAGDKEKEEEEEEEDKEMGSTRPHFRLRNRNVTILF